MSSVTPTLTGQFPEVTEPGTTQGEPSKSSAWEIPKLSDARIPFALILIMYTILGVTVLGFNRTPSQLFIMLVTGCLLDMALARVIHGRKIIPLSAFISCCSLGLLLNYSHTNWLLFFPVFMTIASKYIFTINGRHVFNPSLFGVVTSLLLTNELITAAPAYQWAGGDIAMTAFVLMMALALFIFKVGRNWLILSFLFFYAFQTAIRAYLMRHHIPAEMLFVGTMAAPPFFIFTFYMMTDPGTSPKGKRAQIWLGFGVAMLDFVLHFKQSVFTFFYAAFIIQSGKFIYLHVQALRKRGFFDYLALTWSPKRLRCIAMVGALGGSLGACYGLDRIGTDTYDSLNFSMTKLSPEQSGIHTSAGTILTEVDERVQHLSKWIISVGDSVAVGDVDNDGLMDLFLTNVLKANEDRATIYRNIGNMQFEPMKHPAFDIFKYDYKKNGLASAGTFVDIDSDGDQDLAIAVGWGRSRIFKNQFMETGRADFIDVSDAMGLTEHTVSLAISFLDYDQDAKLDMLVSNALAPYLTAYDTPTKFSLFNLPAAEFEGDNRMLKFLHNGWHNADNGGYNSLYRGSSENAFELIPSKSHGINETRWSLAVATADFNLDGLTDIYIANDFGPDNMYLNDQGKRFLDHEGDMYGDIGRDTYKGMNATVADFDRNGMQDVYISNVHHSLQSEGSLLWMTYPGDDALKPKFKDEATKRGALNERRFGWGADAGDLNNDGWTDIVQANGMVGDDLDPMYEGNKSYWYVNHKLMQSGPEFHTYANMWGDIRGRVIYPDEKRRAYLNMGETGEFYFVDIADKLGVDEPNNSRGVAMADFDNDGDLDLLVTNQHKAVSIYKNTLREDSANESNYVGFTLIGNQRSTHRSAIGTRVILRYNNNGKMVEQFQEITSLSGFSSQGDPRLHFGVGRYAGSLKVEIQWYGGETETRTFGPNQYYRVEQK